MTLGVVSLMRRPASPAFFFLGAISPAPQRRASRQPEGTKRLGRLQAAPGDHRGVA